MDDAVTKKIRIFGIHFLMYTVVCPQLFAEVKLSGIFGDNSRQPD